jgi:hypothetical protein
MRNRSLARFAAPLIALSLLTAACGDDGDAAADKADTTELCKLATQISDQEDFPSAAQIERYRDLAPAQIEDAIAIAAPPMIRAVGDPEKFFTGIAADDVEGALNQIDSFEGKECGLEEEEHPPADALKVDPAAHRVDVTASEYTFAFDTQVPAGTTSFVLTNAGKEAHFMGFSKISPGHTLDEALAYDGDPADAGIVTNPMFDSNLAAPGGKDDEAITVDLTPGEWGMVCFVAAADGTPHAYKGMAVPFTVG